MRLDKLLVLVLIIVCIISCSNIFYIPNGKYCMSYSFEKDKELKGGAPDNTLLINNNRFSYIEYEPYIPTRKGRITQNYLLFNNGDSLRYYFDLKELITYNPADSANIKYYKCAWYKCDK